jgi:hypothetical protein
MEDFEDLEDRSVSTVPSGGDQSVEETSALGIPGGGNQTNLLGIIRSVSLVPSFKMNLWTKSSVK